MRRSLVACLSFVLTVMLLTGPALAQGIVWWEHSNPPHNNYSKELVADWKKTHPNVASIPEEGKPVPAVATPGVAPAPGPKEGPIAPPPPAGIK